MKKLVLLFLIVIGLSSSFIFGIGSLLIFGSDQQTTESVKPAEVLKYVSSFDTLLQKVRALKLADPSYQELLTRLAVIDSTDKFAIHKVEDISSGFDAVFDQQRFILLVLNGRQLLMSVEIVVSQDSQYSVEYAGIAIAQSLQ